MNRMTRINPETLDTHQLPEGGFTFAPGVIEGPRRRRTLLTARQVEKLALFLLVLAYLIALAGLLAVTTGRLTLGALL